jgi:plastocyanin
MRRSHAAILATAAAFGGCGGDGGGAPERTATVPATATARVVGDEYSFDPSALVVTATGTGPAKLTIELVNEGSLAHNLKVERDGRELGGTPTFEGGETRSGSVELATGRYRMVCTVGDHEALGMVGTLEVR